VLLDSYVVGKLDPSFNILAGRFKVPIGLEHLQDDSLTLFIERGFPTQLVPDRDNGAQIFGSFADGLLGYQAAVVNGPADGLSRNTDTSDDKDGVVRLTSTPFTHGPGAVAGWTIGIAGSYGLDAGTAGLATTNSLPTFRTSGQNTFFSYATTAEADGAHWRLAPQSYWSWGPLECLGEYTISHQRVASAVADDEIRNYAWQIIVGVVLTGEPASYKTGVIPLDPFTIGGGGWGAVELVARVHRLDIDEAVFDRGFASRLTAASSATAFGAGINWHLSRQVKVQVDYEHTAFEDGGGGTLIDPIDRETEQLVEVRLQLVF
jgi:phosphate-selective porin OprO and OprP